MSIKQQNKMPQQTTQPRADMIYFIKIEMHEQKRIPGVAPTFCGIMTQKPFWTSTTLTYPTTKTILKPGQLPKKNVPLRVADCTPLARTRSYYNRKTCIELFHEINGWGNPANTWQYRQGSIQRQKFSQRRINAYDQPASSRRSPWKVYSDKILKEGWVGPSANDPHQAVNWEENHKIIRSVSFPETSETPACDLSICEYVSP